MQKNTILKQKILKQLEENKSFLSKLIKFIRLKHIFKLPKHL